jgi:hypothetical protein
MPGIAEFLAALGGASPSTSDSTIERCASRTTERASRSRSPRATTTSLRQGPDKLIVAELPEPVSFRV